MKKNTKKLVLSSLIAAIYAVTTIFLTYPLSYEVSQFRVAEAFTILPFFSFSAVPGLFLGCLIANILSPVGPLDMILGSIATLIASIITYYIGKSNLKFKKFLAPLPAVIVNALIIGAMLRYITNLPLWITILQVGFGEILCSYGLGLPLIFIIDKNIYLKSLLKQI